MPYELLWETDGVHKRFWGTMSGKELADSVEAVAAHPGFDELKFILNDFLAVGTHEIDSQSLERIAVSRFGSRFTNPRIRVALITTDAVLFALSDVTKKGGFPDTNETRGFASVEEARKWIGEQPPIIDSKYVPADF